MRSPSAAVPATCRCVADASGPVTPAGMARSLLPTHRILSKLLANAVEAAAAGRGHLQLRLAVSRQLQHCPCLVAPVRADLLPHSGGHHGAHICLSAAHFGMPAWIGVTLAMGRVLGGADMRLLTHGRAQRSQTSMKADGRRRRRTELLEGEGRACTTVLCRLCRVSDVEVARRYAAWSMTRGIRAAFARRPKREQPFCRCWDLQWRVPAQRSECASPSADANNRGARQPATVGNTV
jgi:hypothetical protein